jgi:hypothetical protein
MSLQTTVDIVKHGFNKCWHIEFLEFMEMIARVGHMQFSDEPLHVAIEKVLQEWLSLVQLTVQEP